MIHVGTVYNPAGPLTHFGLNAKSRPNCVKDPLVMRATIPIILEVLTSVYL